MERKFSTPKLDEYDRRSLAGDFGPIAKAWVESRNAIIERDGFEAWKTTQQLGDGI